MLADISKAVKIEGLINDLDINNLHSWEFTELNLQFIKDVIPKEFSKEVLAQYSNTLDSKIGGELFQDLFKKHNLESLVKQDNLIL